jgi:transcriptional regulator with GAF, ATPase, and Fis domain
MYPTWQFVLQAVSRAGDWVKRLWSAGASLFSQTVTRRRLLVVLATVLVTAYALGVLTYVLAIPEIGLRCAFTPVVNLVFEEFIYPEGQEPIQPGDRVVQLGDQPVENWPQLLRKLISLRDETPPSFRAAEWPRVARDTPDAPSHVILDGHELVRVRFLRGDTGPERSVWCRLGQAPLETLAPSVLWFFLKIGLFAVGAVVFWKRPTDRSAMLFFWLCIASFGAYIGGYHWSRIATQPALLLVFVVCATLLPAVSLHFYLVFPRPKEMLERHPRGTLALVYGPPLAFLLLMLSDYLRLRWLYRAGGMGSEAVRLQLDAMLLEIYVYFGVAMLLYLASIVCLVHSYRAAVDVTERNQVKWILFGALAAAVPIGYSLYLAFGERERFGGGAATWPMFAASACVTVAFTISITRYRLMQLDQILSSGVFYFLYSALAALVYYGLVVAFMLLIGRRVSDWPSLDQALGVGGTALLLLVILDLARGRLKRALDTHFRREKHQLDRTLKRMSQAIEQLVDPPTLARRLLHTSAELLGAASGSVYLRQGEPPLYCLADSLGPRPPLTELSTGCPLIEALRHGAEGIALLGPRSGLSVNDPARRQLQFLGGAVAHSLDHEGEMLGLLVLGPKEDGAYSAEDFNLLAAFARLTVLALVSAEGHRTIDGLNRDLQAKVEKIAEQQRRILALQSQLTTSRSQESGIRSQESANGVEPKTVPSDQGGSSSSTSDSRSLMPESGFVGSSPQVQQLLHLVRKVAASPSHVLLRGESGTGKELLARAVHENSPRVGKAFVKVHCAALSPGLLESELFGHVKGAFTSAVSNKVGRFEAAHGGTLFLDEIGDVSWEVQTKLLRVLQEMTFERVGSSEPVKVDVRLIAATHQDLEGLIRQGRFREDLYYRLNVFPITVPPLRERIEDVPELALHFLQKYARNAGKCVTGIDDDALVLLKSYPWPGNVRQMENVIERAIIIAEGQNVTPHELPDEVKRPFVPHHEEHNGNGTDAGDEEESTGSNGTRVERDRLEREQLVRALAAAGGNKAVAARGLGLARSTFLSRLKKHGLS